MPGISRAHSLSPSLSGREPQASRTTPRPPFIPRCIMSAQNLGKQHAPNTTQTDNPRGRRSMPTTPEPADYEPDFDAIEANLRQFVKDTDYLYAHWEE